MGDTLELIPLVKDLGLLAYLRDDYAAALFGERLAIFREQDDKKGVAECLTGIAGVMSVRGEAKQAAMLFGAAEAARGFWRDALAGQPD